MTQTKNIHPDTLIIASSEADANLYYATRFMAPDDFVFMEIRGKKHLLMNDLEVDRARAQAKVDKVHSTSKLAAEFKEKAGKRPGYLDLIEMLARSEKAEEFLVPATFPIEFADPLRERGFKLTFKRDPFY